MRGVEGSAGRPGHFNWAGSGLGAGLWMAEGACWNRVRGREAWGGLRANPKRAIARPEPNLDLVLITEDSFDSHRILLWIFLTSFCDTTFLGRQAHLSHHDIRPHYPLYIPRPLHRLAHYPSLSLIQLRRGKQSHPRFAKQSGPHTNPERE